MAGMAQIHLELDPANAGMNKMAQDLDQFLQTVNSMTKLLAEIAAATFSTPFSQIFIYTMQELNQIGTAVSTSVNQFEDALGKVYNQWVTVHATTASPAQYSDRPYTNAADPQLNSNKLNVDPPTVDNLLGSFRSSNSNLQTHFTAIGTEMNGSSAYWHGKSHDQTVAAWQQIQSTLWPKVEDAVNNFLKVIGDANQNILQMDQQTYVKVG